MTIARTWWGVTTGREAHGQDVIVEDSADRGESDFTVIVLAVVQVVTGVLLIAGAGRFSTGARGTLKAGRVARIVKSPWFAVSGAVLAALGLGRDDFRAIARVDDAADRGGQFRRHVIEQGWGDGGVGDNALLTCGSTGKGSRSA